MNQILMTKDGKGFLELDLKRSILFFVVLVIVVSGVIAIICGRNLYNSAVKRALREPPELLVQSVGSTVKLAISDKIGVNFIEYSWNDGSEIKYQGEGKENLSLEIEMPHGKNTLAISVTDIQGNVTNFEKKEFTFDSNQPIIDNEKPTIVVERGAAPKIFNIVVTDETSLNYFTYKYGNDKEVRVNVPDDKSTKFVQEIEAKQGSQNLIIVAYDKNGNTEKLETKVTGTTGPKLAITVKQNKYIVKVSDESSISKIEYSINGNEKSITDIAKNSKEYEFEVPLQENIINNLKVKVYNEVNLTTENEIKSNGATIKASIVNGVFVAKITSSVGLSKIEYTVNNKKYTVNDLKTNAKEYELKLNLVEGENRIIIDAFEGDLMTEYKGKKTI